jgi:peptidoglycan/xylan/chitin deacetylase (PgdA/CDA1 family)
VNTATGGTLRSGAAPHAKRLLLGSGFYSVFRRVLPSRKLAILRYHAVCERNAGYADPQICVSPAAFERHAAYLAAHYRVLPLPDAVGALRRGATLPRNAAAITFDDGYADNLGAARTLARHGLTGTFYITAGCLADGAPFWPSELRVLVQAIDLPRIALDVAGSLLELPLGTAGERRAAVGRLTKACKAHPIPVREALRADLRRLAGVEARPSPMLSWDQLREMRDLGMDIGSHTMTHPNLPNAGPVDARREIRESKARLESELGTGVTMFSYPNGGAERYMTPEVASLVQQAGFLAATTSRNAFAGPGSDLFALERVQVSEALENLVFALEVERFALQPKPRHFEAVAR